MNWVLWLVVGPLAIIAVVYGLVYGASARRSRRYRPGRPYEFTPVWFLARPEQLAARADGRAELPALAEPRPSGMGTKGGASGKW